MVTNSRKKIESPCVFCDILENQKDKLIYEDDLLFAFYDKKRKSCKEHILVCPKKHIPDADSLTANDIKLVELMHEAAFQKLKELQPNEKYRFGFHEPPINTISHLHLHGIVEPIKNEYNSETVYGTMLTTPQNLIETLKKRVSSQNSIKEPPNPMPKL